MQFIVDAKIIQQYPSLRIGVVVCRNIHNAKESIELNALKNQLESQFTQKYQPDAINNHPYIVAWRETYRSFGVKPKDYRPTAEALLRRIVRGDHAPTINVAVNCYLLAQLAYFLPVGGYDLRNIADFIMLRFSAGGERFVPLGAREVEMTQPGEVVYADQAKILTRRWNYRDSDEAKMTEDSVDCVLFCEAADPAIPTDAVSGSTQTIADYIERFCGGDIRSFVADVSQATSWEL